MTNRQEQGAPARGERWGSPRAQARPERLVRCWLLRMSRGALEAGAASLHRLAAEG